jgi:uncharacterized membrane protein
VELFPYILIVLCIVVGPWILVWRTNRDRKLEREQARKEDLARWRELSQRVLALDQAVKALEGRSAPTAAPPVEAKPPVASNEPVPAHQLAPPATPARHPIQQREPAPASAQPSTSSLVFSPRPPAERPDPPPVPLRAPTFVAESTSPERPVRSSHEIEEILGTNWLNKLGIVILVLGVAFFLAYQLKTLGPTGKVLVGYVVSGALLGVGVWLERNNRYQILARTGIGGGWALLFFTTYAMYHVPATQVLRSQLFDLLLMFVVAAVMVWHTLRYRSQVVTGLAFLLASLTVTVSHSNVYSLSAGAILAAGLVFIVGRMQWFELEVVGILASYLNHYLWLRPIIEPMEGHHRPFPQFAASAGILVLYWLIFRLSYLLRMPEDERKEHLSTTAALLNTLLLLLLFKYQSVHPEWSFWALLAIGTIETSLGQSPVAKRRRPAVIVLTTIGTVLMVAAFPFRYSGTRLSLFWLAEAEALLLIGVWTRETVFRRLGAITAIVAAGQIISFDAASVYGMRSDDADVSSQPRIAILFAVAGAIFYANAHWIARRWAHLFPREVDRTVMARFSYLGALTVFTGVWVLCPEASTAVAWASLGLVLAFVSRRWKVFELGYQSNLFAGAALLRTAVINFDTTSKFHGVSERLLSILLVAGLLYISSRWSWPTEDANRLRLANNPVSIRVAVCGAYTWAASFLLALLAWYELRPVNVAVAWMLGGLLLMEIGLARKSLQLRVQAYFAFAGAFARIWFVNLDAAGIPGELSPRFYTVVPLVLAFYYAYWRLRNTPDELARSESKFRAADFSSWLGVISLAALMRFEMPADWVATAWAALALALLLIAWRSTLRLFLHQALFILAGVAARACLHNLYERSYFPAPLWQSRWVCVGTTVVLLLAALPILFQLRIKDSTELPQAPLSRVLAFLNRRPEQFFFFGAITLLTVLLGLEMRHGMVTLAWGLEGSAIFVLAIKERSFRLTGLGLLLLCVAKIIVIDVWRLNPRDRYLTFIVLGAALLLVSFLYTRNRETLRQYI